MVKFRANSSHIAELKSEQSCLFRIVSEPVVKKKELTNVSFMGSSRVLKSG